MRQKPTPAYEAAQTLAGKSGALAMLFPGHKARLVFKHSTSTNVLLELEEFEQRNFLSLDKVRGTISMVLSNKEWADDTSEARSFEILVGPRFSFEDFRAVLPMDLFEEIIDLGEVSSAV